MELCGRFMFIFNFNLRFSLIFFCILLIMNFIFRFTEVEIAEKVTTYRNQVLSSNSNGSGAELERDEFGRPM